MPSDFLSPYRELLLQEQLRQAQESVSNMQKLHELAQNQLFEVRAQSGYILNDVSCFSFNKY